MNQQLSPGHIVLLLAIIMNEWLLTNPDITGGWGGICTGGVDVIPLACNHLQVYEEPYVSIIAEHINALIEKSTGDR
jgi:thioesterase domain-containing protein